MREKLLIDTLRELVRQEIIDFEAKRSTRESKAASDQTDRVRYPRQDRWMSAKEVASYLSVSLTTVHNWTLQGRLVKHKIGRAARFDRQEIDRRMDSLSPYKKLRHD